MDEVWKEIPGISWYEASSLGRIRSKDKSVKVRSRDGSLTTRTCKGKVLSLNKVGAYQAISIIDDSGDTVTATVHRLVALAFHENPEGKPQVNHKDGDKKNNASENLEWATASENKIHSYRVLGEVNHCVGKFGADHPTSKAVIRTCITTGETRLFECAFEAVREGFDSGCISRCCSGQNKTHKGYTWKFQSNDHKEATA